VLTRYDEFPVHQSPYPFSVVPVTDYSFDDGYYFGVFSAEQRLFLFQGMRVNPNNDMIGGYAGVMSDGVQHTVRFKRPWRPDCDTRIGPYRYDFVEPFREIHLELADNPSSLRFDLRWLATAPAFEEAHHLASSRGRRTTDQTRYSQAGTARGWLELDGRRIDVTPEAGWFASRDHSWGLYFERPPLAPASRWVRPREQPAVRRALRFWTVFSSPGLAGFYGLHESEDGEQLEMNDTFGTPFEGALHREADGATIELAAARHEVEFVPGTKVMRAATVTLTDRDGGEWVQQLEGVGMPWWPFTIGYGAGSWRDGGSMVSYAGTDDVVIEEDRFDWSEQPFDHVTYDGRRLHGVHGAEHLSRITTTAPDGTVTVGAGQTELFIDGPYRPYGFEA
jgi:hypothetical protein